MLITVHCCFSVFRPFVRTVVVVVLVMKLMMKTNRLAGLSLHITIMNIKVHQHKHK